MPRSTLDSWSRQPTPTNFVEPRFHQTLRREPLDDHPPFATIADAQAALDRFRREYNTDRPHQALDMNAPTDRFHTEPVDELGLRLPPSLTEAADPAPAQAPAPVLPPLPLPRPRPATDADAGGIAVLVDRAVPQSGNLTVCGQQFWFGPAHAGMVVTLHADTTVIHLLRDGQRIKTVPSRLTTAHLGQLLADGGRPATATLAEPGTLEVDRLVNACGSVSLAGSQHPTGYHLAGQRVTLRFDGTVMHILDMQRTLIRTLSNPITDPQLLRDARPGGPPPLVPDTPAPVQRRVSSRGMIQVAWQRIQVGIGYAGLTVTVTSTDQTFLIHNGDELLAEVPRVTDRPIARFKARKPEPPRPRLTSTSADKDGDRS